MKRRTLEGQELFQLDDAIVIGPKTYRRRWL